MMYHQKKYFCFVRVHRHMLIMGLEIFIIPYLICSLQVAKTLKSTKKREMISRVHPVICKENCHSRQFLFYEALYK